MKETKSKKPSFNTNRKSKGNPKDRKLFKNSGKGSSKDTPSVKEGTCNDPAWYNINPQSVKDTASIPYNRATGLNWNLTNRPTMLTNPVTPGILGLGISLDPLSNSKYDDPINVAAREIVGIIRSFNSGAANYDPNDYMLRVLAQADILAWMNFAVRLYATFNMYSPYNRYMPDDLFKVQGVDPDWMRANANKYRARLNHIITKAAAILYVPEQILLFRRYMWLFANYYADSESAKDQIYVMFPTNYHVYEIDNDTSMGMLKNHRFWHADLNETGKYYSGQSPRLHTGDEVLDILEAMLEPLIEDQDLCIINGDMIKAYGPSRLSFSLVDDVTIAVPVYQPDVLWQIRNSRTIPDIVNTDCFDIKQDSNGVILQRGTPFTGRTSSKYYWNDTSDNAYEYETLSPYLTEYDFYSMDGILDTDRLDPDCLLTMENSRMLSIPTRLYNTNDYEIACGPDVVEFYVIVHRSGNSTGGYRTHFYMFKTLLQAFFNNIPNTFNDGTGNTFTQLSYPDAASIIADLSAFEYAPMVMLDFIMLYLDSVTQTPTTSSMFAQLPTMSQNNMAFVSGEALDRMNYTAYLSLLGIKGPNAN